MKTKDKGEKKFDEKLHEGLVCPVCEKRFNNVGEIKEHLENEILDLKEASEDSYYLEGLCSSQLKMLGYR